MSPGKRILFALDVPSESRAMQLVRMLSSHVGGFKIGPELMLSCGGGFIDHVSNYGAVMLDLKLHDIPETVERAVSRAGDLGAKFCTIHVQQRETMRRAVRAAEKTGMVILGVTVLTSMTEQDCKDLRFDPVTDDPAARVTYLARLAHGEGARGFVCSAQEVKFLAEEHQDSIFVVPGIRPAGTDVGDQKRTGTPRAAVAEGASYIVVGRPIRDAEDPVAAAISIAKEIESV